MSTRYIIKKIIDRLNLYSILLFNPAKEYFKCPICDYSGPFLDIKPPTGLRKNAKCPKCGALERHRFQYLVMKNILSNIDTSALIMLHFAPEPFLKNFFFNRFGQYETADLCMKGVDHKVDLQELPFKDQSYDFIFASHILEHVLNDKKALYHIRRILKPNGIAILPVPLVANKTIEYPEPNPKEAFHVRAPGLDYFDRYKQFFTKVELIKSDSLPMIYQLYRYEDRSQWPNKQCPLRPTMQGERFIDIVPVCYA
ncbi:class I SAM-dependent methyltransferase [candidate division KSB1 bacterium]|nr:class I SAM-dependent methyltransferase [candidate division KSB1 bacterium]